MFIETVVSRPALQRSAMFPGVVTSRFRSAGASRSFCHAFYKHSVPTGKGPKTLLTSLVITFSLQFIDLIPEPNACDSRD
jgi:hypothetical protein